MTHTLHRCGSVESLKGDFVLIAMASREKNRSVVASEFPRVARIMFEAGLANIGSVKLRTNIALGFDREEFIQGVVGSNALLCTFSNKEALRAALVALKKANIGISITVSGLIDEVHALAEELNLKPHTVNLSLGVIGKTDRLPEPEILEMTTMCGHALVTEGLVRRGVKDVAGGAKEAEEVALMIGKPCICGIFNLDRAARLLRAAAELDRQTQD